ncbi:MAG: hypothetical protein ABIQ98_02950 [Sphingomicrobium sp.]
MMRYSVIPAQAGTQTFERKTLPYVLSRWVPACAGMTRGGAIRHA